MFVLKIYYLLLESFNSLQMSYAVVIFNNDNEVLTVSINWFKNSGCVL